MEFVYTDLYDTYTVLKNMEHYIESTTYMVTIDFFIIIILFLYILVLEKSMKYKYKKLKYKISHISIV